MLLLLTWDIYGNFGASSLSNVLSQGPENGGEGKGWRRVMREGARGRGSMGRSERKRPWGGIRGAAEM